MCKCALDGLFGLGVFAVCASLTGQSDVFLGGFEGMLLGSLALLCILRGPLDSCDVFAGGPASEEADLHVGSQVGVEFLPRVVVFSGSEQVYCLFVERFGFRPLSLR